MAAAWCRYHRPPSADNLTEKGYDTFFRVCARNDAHGPAVAGFIANKLKAQKVYLLNPKGRLFPRPDRPGGSNPGKGRRHRLAGHRGQR